MAEGSLNAGDILEEGRLIGLGGSDLTKYVQDLLREERVARRERERESEDKRIQAELESEKMQLQHALELERIKSSMDVERGTHEGRNRERARVGAKVPRLPMFDEKHDNIDSYLLRFERFAVNADWHRDTWANSLSALLQYKALEVYTRLTPDEAQDYEIVKDALLKRFQLTEEGFRLKFRGSKPEHGESPSQFVSRLSSYFKRWMELSRTEQSFEGVLDLLLKEQFINSVGKLLSIFLKERKPNSVENMASIAEQYIEAHGVSSFTSDRHIGNNSSVNSGIRRDSGSSMGGIKKCFICEKPGHIAKECLKRYGRVTKAAGCFNTRDYGFAKGRGRGRDKKRYFNNEDQEVKVGSACIKAEMLRDCCVQNSEVKLECGHVLPVLGSACKADSNMPIRTGYVGDKKVNVLRDTGCSGVVVKVDLVKKGQFTGESQNCVLIDGSIRRFKRAIIQVDTPFYKGEVMAICMDSPVYDLIIGNITGVKDLSEVEMIRNTPSSAEKTTQNGGEQINSSKDELSNWKYNTEENRLQEGVDKSGVIKEDVRKKVVRKDKGKILYSRGCAVETRSQKKNPPRFKPLKVTNIQGINIGVEEMKKAQSEDETLEKIFDLANKGEHKYAGKNRANESWFTKQGGLLYRCFQSPKVEHGKIFKQLVVPEQYRKIVLKVAHDSIMAGHLAVKKTTDRVMTNFYWPGIQSHVIRYCRSCAVCQKTVSKGKVSKVPLGYMPLIDTPFERVAVDLVGPIFPATERGHRYILTLVDYSTRYPEATALKGIETEQVAEALVEMFTRVGIPKEVLSDLGAQFTSGIMRAVGRLLSIEQLTTTPYHPSCNGLVEKFNGTLKSMLRRMSEERPKDWDRYIPALLFAYREVPQESLGFSPFELVFGRTVRGPMTILRELWTNEESEPEVKNTYQYIIDLKDRLMSTCEMAKKELIKSSSRYRKYYNKRTKRKVFDIGDKVLLLLPSDNNKLLMQWRGPYAVRGKVGLCDYKIEKEGKIKTYHANLLKKFIERDENIVGASLEACVVVQCEEENEKDEIIKVIPLEATESHKDVEVSAELKHEQRQEVEALLAEYKDILTDLPGRTELVQHEIKLTTNDPIRNKPYQVPYALRDEVRNEIKQMLKMNIIEPSESPYASSIVMVKKPDGSNRMCIDFRKLNKVTVFDAEPMPDPEEIFAKIGRSVYYTKIDLSKGYYQIPMREEDKNLTSFITPDGLFRFKVMAFGMINSAATFNRMMRMLLKNLKHTDSFVDDILVHTETWADHIKELRLLFEVLRKHNVTARPTKCRVGFRTVEFLGHQVGDGYIKPNESKLLAVKEAPRPKTKKQLRSFLGLLGYYRKYVAHFATIAVPLTDLTKKGCPNNLIWEDQHQRAFEGLKKYLLNAPILRLLDLERRIIIRTDASDYGLGGIMMQEHDDKLYPVAYVSRKLLEREKAYSVIEKECLAIVWCLQKLQVYIYGRMFVLQTDHQPLSYLQQAKVNNGRLMRWALQLQAYNFTIEAIKGIENLGADFLSRNIK